MSTAVATGASAITEAAQLGREAEQSHAVTQEEIDSGLLVRVLRNDQAFQAMDLEQTMLQPHQNRGTAVLHDPTHFGEYVNRLADNGTTLWADPDRAWITAVFDDHADADTPGWRQHRATLQLRRDPEWTAWVGHSGRPGSQAWFAEFVEDHAACVVDPSAATMLEVSRTFQAHRSVSFEKATRLQSGDVQLRFQEETTAKAGQKGTLEVPEKFTINVAPYIGTPPVIVEARLRYRIEHGDLKIGYQLHRADLVEQTAFDAIRGQVDNDVAAPVYLGEAPPQLRPVPPNTPYR